MIAKLTAAYVLLAVVWTAPLIAAQGSADKWTDKEMGKDPDDPKGTPLKLPLLPQGRPFPAGFQCKEKDNSPECIFDLAYFLGDGFDVNKKQRFNILFIPGGPGAIVDPSSRSVALRVLERKHNVVYFHPRGMAQSAINGDKDFDQFLRADYVVEDIEKLRQVVLKNRPWDAIYAHSWGTMIAQRYAAKFGKAKGAPLRVLSLLLSGPVDRHRESTHGARSQMMVANLKMILSYYRSQGAANCQCESAAFLRPIVTDFSDPQISTFGNRLGASDNFCFLIDEVADKILKQLEKMIGEIDDNYGSADFIVDHFAALKSDKDFQKRFEKLPIEFFVAVRYLQMSGAPAKDSLVFTGDSRNRINAALVIGHYLSAADRGRCDDKARFFSGAAADCEYCARLKDAKQELRMFVGGRESRRGNYVFGVYDGVTRWAPAMMGITGCFTGKDLERFADRSGGDKQFGREQAKRIGIVPDEKICPWNPADYRHEVPTLLIKGSRDTVVAGCQAEDFFTNGLQDGRRVLLEFRGLGHDLSVANLHEASDPSNWTKSFAGLLEDFIKMSAKPSQFRSDSKVRAKLKKLKVTDRTRDTNVAKCGKIS